MILDADMTVPPEDLPYFYRPLREGLADFINGTRLIYPMATGSMKLQNFIGNKLFGVLVSWLDGHPPIGHPVRDEGLLPRGLPPLLDGLRPVGRLRLSVRGCAAHLQGPGGAHSLPERRAGQSKMKALQHTWALLKACWAGFWRVKYPRSSAGDITRTRSPCAGRPLRLVRSDSPAQPGMHRQNNIGAYFLSITRYHARIGSCKRNSSALTGW